jgi:hypothetical protein
MAGLRAFRVLGRRFDGNDPGAARRSLPTTQWGQGMSQRPCICPARLRPFPPALTVRGPVQQRIVDLIAKRPDGITRAESITRRIGVLPSPELGNISDGLSNAMANSPPSTPMAATRAISPRWSAVRNSKHFNSPAREITND